MSLNDEFIQLLPNELRLHRNNLLILRENLVEFKNRGMDKDSMLGNLEKLRATSDSEIEDILLELMDFVAGYCSQHLAIFDLERQVGGSSAL